MPNYEIIPLVGKDPVFHNTQKPAEMPIGDKNFSKFADKIPAALDIKPMVTAVKEAMSYLLNNTHGNNRKNVAINVMMKQSGIGEVNMTFEQQLKINQIPKKSNQLKPTMK